MRIKELTYKWMNWSVSGLQFDKVNLIVGKKKNLNTSICIQILHFVQNDKVIEQFNLLIS